MTSLHPNIHKEDKMHDHDSSDDEVPQSFKVQTTSPAVISPKFADESLRPDPRRNRALYTVEGRKLPPSLPTNHDKSPSSLPMPSKTSGFSDIVNEHDSHGLRDRATSSQRSSSPPRQFRNPMRGLDDYEKALWNWVNVYNLDAFLQEAYTYYEGKGIYSIALARGLNLLSVLLFFVVLLFDNPNRSTIGFVIGFSTFLLGCVDYSSLRRHSHSRLSDVIVPHCVSRSVAQLTLTYQNVKVSRLYRFSGFTLLFFLLFTAFYVWQIITFLLGIQRLVDMYKFYTHLLKIPDVSIHFFIHSYGK